MKMIGACRRASIEYVYVWLDISSSNILVSCCHNEWASGGRALWANLRCLGIAAAKSSIVIVEFNMDSSGGW